MESKPKTSNRRIIKRTGSVKAERVEECSPDNKKGSLPVPFISVPCMVIGWDTKATGKVCSLKIMTEDYPIHPMKGLRVGNARSPTSYGQRIYIVIDKGDNHILFKDEAMLIKWSDDSISGQSFTLLLDPTGEGEHPLASLKSDRKHGDVVFVNAWILHDDETLHEKITEYSPTKLAAIYCSSNEDFHRFCRRSSLLSDEDLQPVDTTLHDKDFCAEFIRIYCGITSRAEFKIMSPHGEQARMRWKLLLSHFDKWRLSN